MKLCYKCKQQKELTEFAASKFTKSGFQDWCRACHTIHRTTYKVKYKESQETTKRCRACNVTKLFQEFAINRGHSDGHQNWCRSCCTDKQRELRSRKRTLALWKKIPLGNRLSEESKRKLKLCFGTLHYEMFPESK